MSLNIQLVGFKIVNFPYEFLRNIKAHLRVTINNPFPL